MPQAQAPLTSDSASAVANYTENDVPHPQELFACGLLKMKPLLTRLVS